ncbi:MAG: extracellular solute-binding protein [Oscillospiraceae bacterium]|nr:extracellular solute-binding protein [Oscillospiraceae bacterium]
MKKIISVVLVMILVVSLAACAGQDSAPGAPAPGAPGDSGAAGAPAESGERVHLTFWNMFSGGDGDIMTEMVNRYNAGDNQAYIEMTIFPSEEYYVRLITAMATRTAPDVAVSHITSLTEFVTDDFLSPLDDLAAAAGLSWNEFSANLVEGVYFDGSHFAIPIDTHVLLMHFNVQILDDLGMLDANGRPAFAENGDDFIRFFREVQAGLDGDMMPISGTSQGELPLYLWYSLFTQQGGQMISADGRTATLDTPENHNALSFMHQLINEDLWPRAQASGAQIFVAQQAAATFNGNWGIPMFTAAEGLDFISLPFPQIFGQQQSVFGDSHTLILPRQSDEDPAKQAAAMDFMNWMADNTILWAQAGHVPSKTAIVDSAEFNALPHRSAYAHSAAYATFYPKTTVITGMKASFVRIFASMINGEYDVAQAQELMQSELQRLLDDAH